MDTIDRKELIGFALLAVLVNFVLMAVKILTGLAGNSQALIADGIESASDVVVSLITWIGFHLSLRPPDHNHPFGHGRLESLAGLFSGFALAAAAVFIAAQSVREIAEPGQGPEWFTLPVLAAVIAVKELFSRRLFILADKADSLALHGDAWHHRSDALTSAAAAIGVSVALIGGPAYAAADDWAALLACTVILFNAGRVVSRSLHENLDGRVDSEITGCLLAEAARVAGVIQVEKCVARKSGYHYFAEMHVQVDPHCSVETGHRIGHQVKDRLLSQMPNLRDVVIHLEPFQGKTTGL